jgi:hypothetical protein
MLGYPFVAIAVYWLAQSDGTLWNSALGNFWALVAITMFVHGFKALNQPTAMLPPSEQGTSCHNRGTRGDSECP